MARQVMIASLRTEVTPLRSLEQIRKLVETFGAREFTTKYNDLGAPTAIKFRAIVGADMPDGLPIELPIPVDNVYRTLIDTGKPHGSATLRQAERIAWRNAHDFIRASLIAVQTGILSLGEAFLSSVVVSLPDNESGTIRVGELLLSGRFLHAKGERLLLTDGGPAR